MVLLIAFPIKMKAQTIKNYPIPSYNIITNGSANFLEYSSCFIFTDMNIIRAG